MANVEPQVGMMIEIYRQADGGEEVASRGRIAAVSGNRQTVWTFSGQRVRLDSVKHRLFWPEPDDPTEITVKQEIAQ